MHARCNVSPKRRQGSPSSEVSKLGVDSTIVVSLLSRKYYRLLRITFFLTGFGLTVGETTVFLDPQTRCAVGSLFSSLQGQASGAPWSVIQNVGIQLLLSPHGTKCLALT